ncbi:MAG: DUF86 domain-containing protein [Xanthobacteraceae bacterium]
MTFCTPSTVPSQRLMRRTTIHSGQSFICRAQSNDALRSSPRRHIPKHMTARYPHIPWRQIAGIGNVLRHSYDIVDDRIIWEIASVHFPALRTVVVEIRSQLPDDD